MPRTKAFGFIRTLAVLIAATTLFVLHLHGQRLDRRTLRGPGAKAIAGKFAASQAHSLDPALAPPPPTANGTFITFEVPGAVNGTFPASINDGGVVTGSYGDNVGSGSHGFVRSANGNFTTFDVPGAIYGTFPTGINSAGVVAGWYADNLGSGDHGFVRPANGRIETFDAPGAGYVFLNSVINPRGEVAGSYFDVNFIQHSFLREPSGTLTTIDPPAAINGSFPSAITPNGTILGIYYDADFNSIGFVRDSSGTFTEVTGPAGLTGQYDGYSLSFGAPLSITPGGEIAGTYFEPINGNPFGGNYRVFLLSKHGDYITFDAANYPPCCIFSSPSGINPAGTAIGMLNDGFNLYRGFLRTSDGNVAIFDAPGAGTGYNQGTIPIGITPGGVIAGVYVGPNDGSFFGNYHGHGFFFMPQ